MRILTFIALTLGLAVSAMAQVAVQQPPGTYTNNSVMIRDGAGNKTKNTANLTYVTEDSALNLFQLNGSYGGTGVNFVMGRTEEAFRINSSSAVTNLRTVDGAALRFSPSAGEVMELSYNSGTGAKLVEVTGDITISGGISADGVNDLPGSVIRAPAPITITEASPDTGTITITNANSVATIDEATTLAFSGNGAAGQQLKVSIVNSTASPVVATLTNCTPTTTTIAALSTQAYLVESTGSAWAMPGGDPYAEKFYTGISAVGTDAYAGTLAGVSALYAGLAVTFEADVANTAGATFNLNAIGATTITKSAGGSSTAALETGDILAGDIVNLVYDGANFKVVSRLAASSGGSGDVVGPASSVDNMAARFDSTTGKLLQNSTVAISDNGDVEVPSAATAGLRVFNTVDKATNFTSLDIKWVSDVAYVINNKGGSGADRTMVVGTAAASRHTMRTGGSSTGQHEFSTANSSTANNIGYYFDNGSQTQTSGSTTPFKFTVTYNQASGTAANSGIWLNAAETALGSGEQNLVKLSTTALGDMWKVSNRGKMSMYSTVTAGGTTGNQTIDKPTGTVNIAAAGTTVTVTNALCTTSSIVLCGLRTNDTTAYIRNCVPGSGSFVITLGAAATAEVSIGFLVIN